MGIGDAACDSIELRYSYSAVTRVVQIQTPGVQVLWLSTSPALFLFIQGLAGGG